MQESATPELPENSIVIHHSDSESEGNASDGSPYRPTSPRSPLANTGNEIGDKAGIILGIHNLYLVCPQFIVTFLSSLIFAVMEPTTEMPGHHPLANPVIGINGTSSDIGDIAGNVEDGMIGRLRARAEAIGTDVSSPAAVGLIFR